MTLFEFECRGHRFALPLGSVRRVVPSARPTLLPGAPAIVLGVLNIGGEVVTVINFFSRVGLPFPAIQTAQRLIVADIAGLRIGFIVDSALGVTEREPGSATDVPERLAGADFVDVILRLDDGLCIIVDPEKFLFDDERALLGNALEKVAHESR